jgi:hypothetical protein
MKQTGVPLRREIASRKPFSPWECSYFKMLQPIGSCTFILRPIGWSVKGLGLGTSITVADRFLQREQGPSGP